MSTLRNADEGAAVARDDGARAGGSELPAALELSSVYKRYGSVQAVAGVDLVVEKGECVTVLGPSGSGKTTLLRIIAGFVGASSGSVRINGREVSNVAPAKRGIGMVFQDYALFPHMSVGQNVAYGLKVRRWSRDRQRERVAQMLDVVGLAGMQDRLPRQLSGGQQQRVALARALAFDPELLLMDEPLGALDRELRVRMTGELRRIQRELRTTLIYVTHDRDEALTLSDRIAIMREGVLEGLGTPQALYAHPETRFVASFFGWHNVVDVDVVGYREGRATVAWLGQQLAVPAGASVQPGPHGLVVPTRAMRVAGDEDTRRAIAGDVIEALYMGDELRARVQLASGDILVAHLPTRQPLRDLVGETIALSVDEDRLTVVPADARAVAS